MAPIPFFCHGNFNLHLSNVPIITRLLLRWECVARLLSVQLGLEKDEQCCTPVIEGKFSVPELDAASVFCLMDIKLSSAHLYP